MPASGRMNVLRRHKTHDLSETANHKVRPPLSVVDVAGHAVAATVSAPRGKAVHTMADHKIKNALRSNVTTINPHANPKSETRDRLQGQHRRGQQANQMIQWDCRVRVQRSVAVVVVADAVVAELLPRVRQ
jgi:hypothetical protein